MDTNGGVAAGESVYWAPVTLQPIASSQLAPTGAANESIVTR